MSYEKVCGTCTRLFSSSDYRTKYCPVCKPKRNRARTQNRESHALQFVGVDGEGVDRPDGTHEYVMLSVGDKTLFQSGTRLALRDILSFLWECYQESPDATYIGFFLGYDFTQWFRQLPESSARFLFTTAGVAARRSMVTDKPNPVPDPVVWMGWEFDLMAGRRFKLRPHRHVRSLFDSRCRNRTCAVSLETVPGDAMGTDDAEVRPVSGKHGWLYVCDTGSFWQTSFLNVIKPENWHGKPVCTDDEYTLIRRGKESRGETYEPADVSYFDEMRMYNVLENAILARVTERLNQGFMNDEIPIRLRRHEWYGPGRAAQTWMDSVHKRLTDTQTRALNRKTDRKGRSNEYGILNADIYLSVPSWFVEAAQSSYYGGWFEIAMHGHVGTVHEYDINSAYPYVISTLPCLHTSGAHTGRYYRGIGAGYPTSAGSYTLLYGEFRGSNPYLGTLPFRTKAGNILRPHRVKGWYWAHEVDAARRAGLIDSVSVETWVSYDACSCPAPFNLPDIGIRRMYDLRIQMGKNTAAGKAFKLVYNSAYGKTAQSIGTPKFANPIYASLITSGCRTLILQAIAGHPMGPRGVAMVATDGVYFLDRHPSLPLSENALGSWDEKVKENMTLLMPGVYWDEKARTAVAAGEVPKMKSRGVAARDLAGQISRLDHEFAVQHARLLTGQTYDWPEIRFPIRFSMVSSRLALHRGDWTQAGRVEHDTMRALSANPENKRLPEPYVCPDTGIIRTPVYPQWSTIETTPYNKSFGYVLDEQLRVADDFINRDGADILSDYRTLLTEP